MKGQESRETSASPVEAVAAERRASLIAAATATHLHTEERGVVLHPLLGGLALQRGLNITESTLIQKMVISRTSHQHPDMILEQGGDMKGHRLAGALAAMADGSWSKTSSGHIATTATSEDTSPLNAPTGSSLMAVLH